MPFLLCLMGSVVSLTFPITAFSPSITAHAAAPAAASGAFFSTPPFLAFPAACPGGAGGGAAGFAAAAAAALASLVARAMAAMRGPAMYMSCSRRALAAMIREERLRSATSCSWNSEVSCSARRRAVMREAILSVICWKSSSVNSVSMRRTSVSFSSAPSSCSVSTRHSPRIDAILSLTRSRRRRASSSLSFMSSSSSSRPSILTYSFSSVCLTSRSRTSIKFFSSSISLRI
mmetsp:Transcript_20048/g.49718  ORF Transcript_20048/g.49718 Transcript_20048/m.49718 type:complete len:232 (+) Transcript_20048:1695-2390(+)